MVHAQIRTRTHKGRIPATACAPSTLSRTMSKGVQVVVRCCMCSRFTHLHALLDDVYRGEHKAAHQLRSRPRCHVPRYPRLTCCTHGMCMGGSTLLALPDQYRCAVRMRKEGRIFPRHPRHPWLASCSSSMAGCVACAGVGTVSFMAKQNTDEMGARGCEAK